MVKKILKAILAVLAVVTAFICGAYVQSSTGRQMPVMAQRRNAINPNLKGFVHNDMNDFNDFGIYTTDNLINYYNRGVNRGYEVLGVSLADESMNFMDGNFTNYFENAIDNRNNLEFVLEYNTFYENTVSINYYLNPRFTLENNILSDDIYYFYWNYHFSFWNSDTFFVNNYDCYIENIYSIESDIDIFNLYNDRYNGFLIRGSEIPNILNQLRVRIYIYMDQSYDENYVTEVNGIFSFNYSLFSISDFVDSIYDNNYDRGYSEGYDEGYDEGNLDGYERGYNEGYTSGVAASSDPYYDLTDAKFDLGMLDNNNDFYYVFRNHDIELVDNYYDFTQYVFNALSEYHSEGYESEYIELELYDFNSFNGASFEINVQGFTKIYISYDRNETEIINIGDPSSLETIELRNEGLVTDFTLLVDPNYTNQQTYKLGFNYLNTYENGYESGYMTGLKNGRNEVIDDPNKYNLYNTTQYDNYGKAQYQTGYNEGIRQDAPTGLEWFKSAISVTNAFLDIQILPGVKLIHICGGFIILGLLKWILDWFRG